MPKYEPWNTEVHEIYKRSIKAHGRAEQCVKMIEVCGKLIVSLSLFRRAKVSDKDVVTKIADVLVVIDQLKVIFGEAKVDREKERRLAKLENKLNVADDMG